MKIDLDINFLVAYIIFIFFKYIKLKMKKCDINYKRLFINYYYIGMMIFLSIERNFNGFSNVNVLKLIAFLTMTTIGSEMNRRIYKKEDE